MDPVQKSGEPFMGVKSAIKAEAARLGFSLFGVTTPQPPATFSTFIKWVAAGRHGQMSYLSSDRSLERRSDPTRILPEVRSIVVVGMPYPRPHNFLPSEPGIYGKVAAYAWGKDYHDIIPPRLELLAARLASLTGQPAASRAYTDTGPILERDLASRAGLGWIGKNTCLINPKTGSYYLLGELLTSVEIEPDQPFSTDLCGTCHRCIDACPTGCILPDRTLDATRCISYLTIENKGAIPEDLRSKMGSWVFGCDVCQQVCPWNLRFAEAIGEISLSPQPEVAFPELVSEIQLSPQEFNGKFKASPIQRAKRRGYLRNVAVTLGNSRSLAAVPALAEVLKSEPEALVRAHAAWALGQIGGDQAISALRGCAEIEENSQVFDEIQSSLVRLGHQARD